MDVPYTITIRPSKTYTPGGAPIPAAAITGFSVEKRTTHVDTDYVPVGDYEANGFEEIAVELDLPEGLSTAVRVTQLVNDGTAEYASTAGSRSVIVPGEPPVQEGLPSTAPSVLSIVPSSEA